MFFTKIKSKAIREDNARLSRFLGLAVFAAAFIGTGDAVAQEVGSVPTVITLGTAGGPILRSERNQPASLLLTDNQTFLVDAGEGAGPQLSKSGMQVADLDAIFITHLHADHMAGLPSILFSMWMEPRSEKLQVYGPKGTEAAIASAIDMLDIPMRLFREQLPQNWPRPVDMIDVIEVEGNPEKVVFNVGGVVVRVEENSHFDQFLKVAKEDFSRSVAYRFESNGKTVVFTGDTGPSSKLEVFAAGADLLVSEVMDLDGILATLSAMSGEAGLDEMAEHMRHDHLTAQALAELANAAKVKSVLLTHYVGGKQLDAEMIAKDVRASFDGTVTPSYDLGRYPVK